MFFDLFLRTPGYGLDVIGAFTVTSRGAVPHGHLAALVGKTLLAGELHLRVNFVGIPSLV